MRLFFFSIQSSWTKDPKCTNQSPINTIYQKTVIRDIHSVQLPLVYYCCSVMCIGYSSRGLVCPRSWVTKLALGGIAVISDNLMPPHKHLL